MARVESAGLLVHRRGAAGPELLLAHMGGPFWARRDEGAWTIPKGELEPGEEPVAAALREFAEELGLPPPPGTPVPLGSVVQSAGKRVTAFALAGDLDVSTIAGATFEAEWPPRSGRRQSFPEVDRAAWLDPETARRLLVRGQVPLVDRLVALLAAAG